MTGTEMKIYTYQEIVDRFGKEIADRAISTGADLQAVSLIRYMKV